MKKIIIILLSLIAFANVEAQITKSVKSTPVKVDVKKYKSYIEKIKKEQSKKLLHQLK